MPIENLDPPAAHKAMSQDPRHVFHDVRTVQEFEAGHPRGALNVPWSELDPATGARDAQRPDQQQQEAHARQARAGFAFQSGRAREEHPALREAARTQFAAQTLDGCVPRGHAFVGREIGFDRIGVAIERSAGGAQASRAVECQWIASSSKP